MKQAVAIVMGLALLAVGSPALPAEPHSAPAVPPNYPPIITPLPKDQLDKLRADFAVAFKGVCAGLNDYGFTTAAPSCPGPDPSKKAPIDIENVDAVIYKAGPWLTDRARFTGKRHGALLVINQVDKIKGCPTCAPPDRKGSNHLVFALRVTFDPQLISDLPVEGDLTPMAIELNADGVTRVEGFWLPDVHLPIGKTMPSHAATDRLLGRPLAPPGGQQPVPERVITLQDVGHPAKRVVFVRQSPPGLEVHVAWKIPVGDEPRWTFYVDAITGEVLKGVPPG